MPWNQVFPLGTDQVSQAPALFQQNWAFLAGSIGQDHFFNTGAPNEGHHKFVQLLGAGDAALAAGMSAVAYSKAMGTANSEQPFWRNAVNIRQIPTLLTGTTAPIPLGPQTTTVFNFAGQPATHGLFQIFMQGGVGAMGVGYYVWNGVNVYVLQLGVSGTITGLSNSVNSRILVDTIASGTAQFSIYTLPL